MLILQIAAGLLLYDVVKFIIVVLFKATVKTVKENVDKQKIKV